MRSKAAKFDPSVCPYISIIPDDYLLIDPETLELSLHPDTEKSILKPFFSNPDTKVQAFVLLAQFAEAYNALNEFWKQHYFEYFTGGIQGFTPYQFPNHFRVQSDHNIKIEDWENIEKNPAIVEERPN